MGTKPGGGPPRAVIHKRILESAESQPDASMSELAADVAGASPDLVERVLDEYGDPGLAGASADPDPEVQTDEGQPGPSGDGFPAPAELTERERTTLEAVAAWPDATQAELAEELGVTRATVNKRLNDIPGFDWSERRTFVEAVLEEAAIMRRSPTDPAAESDPGSGAGVEDDADRGGDATVPDEGALDGEPDPAEAPALVANGGQLLPPESATAVEQLQERVARLENREGGARPLVEDATLVAKVTRAVVADETITDEEELRVLEALLGGGQSR